MRLWNPQTSTFTTANYAVGNHSAAFMNIANSSKQYYIECLTTSGINKWEFRNLNTGLVGIQLFDNANWNGLSNVKISQLSFAKTYTVTGIGANGCTATDDVDLTVNPLPVVDAGLDVSFCIDAGVQTLLGSPLGGVWSGSGVSIGGDFDPSSVVVGMHTLTYTYTDGNSCVNSDTRDITVNGLPVVNSGSDITECDQSIPVNLSGSPSGGLWSGSHVTSAGVYTPNGLGVFLLTYTYTDVNGCVNTNDITATVVAPSDANAGLDIDVCIDTGTIIFTGSNSPNNGLSGTGLWSGNGITVGGQYTVSTVGVYTFTYSYGTGTCLTTDDVDLTVNPQEDATFAYSNSSYCSDDSDPSPTISGTAGGTFTANSAGLNIIAATGLIDLDASTPGTYTITYSTPGANCSATSNQDVTITTSPTVDLGADLTVCQGATQTLDAGSGYSYLWSDNSTNQTLDVSTFGIYSVTITDGNNCTADDQINISQETVDVSAGFDQIICEGNSVTLNGANSHGTICATADEDNPATLTAPLGAVFTNVVFASYGLPTGSCGNFSVGSCHSNTSQSVAEGLLIGQNNVTISASNGVFGDPCVGTRKRLYIEVQWVLNNVNNSYTWNNGVSDGVAFIPTTTNTYTVTGTSANNCTATDDVVVTVNPQEDATFAYSNSSYCADDSDPSPTISGTSGGTFTANSAGLNIIAATGLIDLDASTPGTYTITYSTPGANCSATSTQDVTITAPSTDFNYGGDTEFCLGTTNPVATITGASGGTFSATGGLTIDASTGQIDLSTAIAGNYQVTYTSSELRKFPADRSRY